MKLSPLENSQVVRSIYFNRTATNAVLILSSNIYSNRAVMYTLACSSLVNFKFKAIELSIILHFGVKCLKIQNFITWAYRLCILILICSKSLYISMDSRFPIVQLRHAAVCHAAQEAVAPHCEYIDRKTKNVIFTPM